MREWRDDIEFVGWLAEKNGVTVEEARCFQCGIDAVWDGWVAGRVSLQARVTELEEEAQDYRSNQTIVDRCNELARELYALEGYKVREDFKFYDAHHPHEVRVWRQAVEAYSLIEGTPVDEALEELREETEEDGCED